MNISTETPKSRLRVLLAATAMTGLLLGGLSPAGDALAAAPTNEKSAGYLEEARDFIDQNEWRAALVQLKNSLQADPDNVEARILLGDVHLRMRNGPAAEKEFRQAVRRGADKAEVAVRLGEAYLLQRKFDEVLSEVKVADAAPEQQVAVLLLRGDAFLGKQEIEDAVASYIRAEELKPETAGPKIGIARTHLLQRDLPAAEVKIDEAIALEPRNVEALLLKGEVSRIKRNYEEAYANFDTALGIEETSVAARLGRATSLVELNRLDEAEADLDAVFEATQNHPTARYLAARIAWQRKDVKGARDQLQAAGPALDNFLPAIFLNGLVSYAEGNLEQSAFHLSRVLQFAPTHTEARRFLAMTYLRQNEAEQAIETIQPLLDEGKADGRIYSLMGYAYMRLGDFERGSEFFDRSVEVNPETASNRTRLAVSRMAQGDFDAAAATLEEALAKDPDDLQSMLILAMVQLRQKNFDQALELSKTLKESFPENPVGYYVEGEVFLDQGELAKARRAFETAQKVNPNNLSPSLKLARIDISEGKLDAAEARYKGMLEANAEHVASLVGLSDLAFNRGDTARGLELLERAADLETANLQLRLKLVTRYLEMREFEKAQTAATRLTQEFPEEPVGFEALGKVQMARGDTLGAVASFQRVASLRPDLSSSYHLLAQAERANGDLVSARQTLETARQLAPEPGAFAADRNRIGTAAAILLDAVALEAGEKDFDRAMIHASELDRLYPDSLAGEVTRADIHLEQGEFARALDLYKTIMAESPGGTSIAINIYRANVGLGETETGLAELSGWVDEHPQDRMARGVLASALLNHGDLDGARVHYEALLEGQSKDALTLNNLAWIYQQQGNAKAVDLARQAHELAPQSPEIMDTYAWILVNSGEAERGLELLKRANIMRPGMPEIRYHLAVALAETGAKEEARRELRDLLDLGIAFGEEAAARALLEELGN